MEQKDINPCIIIPTYNHTSVLDDIITYLHGLSLDVLLINDGSTAANKQILIDIATRHSNTSLCHFRINRGKGAAVMSGLKQAYNKGYTHALQVDADGQHDITAVTDFLQMARLHPNHLIQGQPVYDASAPFSRKYGRYINHLWVCVETVSTRIVDTMCGFRVYPLAASMGAITTYAPIAPHMDFDTDIYVALRWSGVPVLTKSIAVIYKEGNLSNFNGLRDNIYISLGHSKRVLRLLRHPIRHFRHLRASANTASKKNNFWYNRKEYGSNFALNFVFLFYRLLGRNACLALFCPVSWYYMLKKPVRDSLTQYQRHLAQAGIITHKPNAKFSRQIIFNFAVCALDRFLAWDPNNHNVEMAASAATRANLAELITNKQGAIFLGCHVGLNDITRAKSFSMELPTINVLAHAATAQRYLKVLGKKGNQHALNFIETKQFDPATALELQSRLDRGEWLFCSADRIISDMENKASMHIPFLGETANFPTGPYLMAALFHCPVYTVLNVPKPSSDGVSCYENRIEPLFETVTLKRNTRQEDLKHYMQHYAHWLEQVCKDYPQHWFNFFDFWQQTQGNNK